MEIEGRKLTDEVLGFRVLYVPKHAKGDRDHEDCEQGVISSWNDNYVFVRYGSDTNAKSTSPDDLVWW